MLVSFFAPLLPTHPLVRSSCTLYDKQFRFPVAIFFLLVFFCLGTGKLREYSAVRSSLGLGVGVGNGLRLENDLLSTVKAGLGGDLESMGRRGGGGHFVNCTLLDRFFVGFTKVQICSLKLPPLFFF
jgi:hypothetical protein